jgi:hypothetical protein
MATTLLAISSLGAFTSGSGPVTDYPSEDDVRDGVQYDFGSLTGNLELPAENEVELGVGYGSHGTEYTGTLSVPTPPTPVPPVAGMSPFASIAQAVKNRLITMTGLDPAWVLVVASDKYAITVAEDMFLYLQFFGITSPRDPALDYTNSGAGRLSMPVARRLRIYLYERSGTDTYGDDSIALMGTDPSQIFSDYALPGMFVLEEMVFNALVNWTPLSGDVVPVPLTLTPLHPLDSSEEPQRPPENEAGLLRSCLDFEVVFNLCIDPTEPNPQVT